MLRRCPFTVFCDSWTASWEPISHTVCSDEVSQSQWYRELTLNFGKRITQHWNCELAIFANCLIHSLNKIIGWHSLPSLTACITNVCTSCFKVSATLLHFAVTHESFTIHITYLLMNFGCIAPFHIKKLNFSAHFTFGRVLFLSMFTCSLRAQNWQVRCYAIDGHTRDTSQYICAKLHMNSLWL